MVVVVVVVVVEELHRSYDPPCFHREGSENRLLCFFTNPFRELISSSKGGQYALVRIIKIMPTHSYGTGNKF